MCGLAGFWTTETCAVPLDVTASAMAERIRHRGPDDRGAWCDTDAGFAVAHRRLAILDLSRAGHQPMLSANGRWVIAYNGEIYNHLDLRKLLQADGCSPDWRGHSDTETLLAAVTAWGVEDTLKRAVGMFAIALWDRDERMLWLVRDRMGEKPLYYGWQGNTFLFGSEIKALRAHPAFNATVDRGALTLLLRHNYVPSPHSIYTDINKLPAGTLLCLRSGQRSVVPTAYWSLAEVAKRGIARPFQGSDSDALATLNGQLVSAVRRQMLSDVPLGVLLSGGIDSGTIAALMQANSPTPVRTFTIGFEESAYDEAAHARRVAAHLGTDHTELSLSGNDALALVPQIAQMYDEPFADSSQLPTHLVMKLARTRVTVALSGDGGDELFGGYNRYRWAPEIWRRLGWMSPSLRRAVGAMMTMFPSVGLNRLLGPLTRSTGVALPGDKIHKLGQRLPEMHSLEHLYLSLVSEWPDAEQAVVGGYVPGNPLDDLWRCSVISDPVARMMVADGLTYLADDVLTKVDRASMAVSLETRAPMLDRDVIEFAWTLPAHLKLRGKEGKWLLRSLLRTYLPEHLVLRPKKGFAIPLDTWLRGPLRGWAESLLSEDRLRRDGYFEPQIIRTTWQRHLSGAASYGARLWSVLMFQGWLEDVGSNTR